MSMLLAACGGAPPRPVAPAPPPPPPPAAPAAPEPPPPDPFAVPDSPGDDDGPDAADAAAVDLAPWKKVKKTKGVPPPPKSCAAYAKRAASKEPPSLLDALAEKDPAKRDARLVSLKSQALRADLAPIECADAIVDPFLDSYSGASTASAGSVRLIVGLSLAGKLARTASSPPAMGTIRDKEKVKAFINGPLKNWLLEQSTAIEVLSSGAAGLTGYARGIAAIEAGIAEMRLVDKMRSAPVPASWDPELKSIYEAALDEALEPRKKRGRDAALVGMSDFARAGVLRDTRVDRARALLSKLYGGRRIDALDGLLVPSSAAPAGTTQKDLAVANTPVFWLANKDLGLAEDPRTLSRGVTKAMRERFKGSADATTPAPAAGDELRSPYARTRLDMGRIYWRRVDFLEAARAAKTSSVAEDRLVLAVSLALAQGPNGAAEMMRAATPSALDTKHTEALDALVAEGGPLAGMAAYDAAHLRALSPPEGDDATAYLTDVAARFRKAELLLSDPAQKKKAAQRAGEVDAIVAAAAKSPPKQ